MKSTEHPTTHYDCNMPMACCNHSATNNLTNNYLHMCTIKTTCLHGNASICNNIRQRASMFEATCRASTCANYNPTSNIPPNTTSNHTRPTPKSGKQNYKQQLNIWPLHLNLPCTYLSPHCTDSFGKNTATLVLPIHICIHSSNRSPPPTYLL